MLQLTLEKNPTAPPLKPVDNRELIRGLREDTDYCISWADQLDGDRLFVDDVEVRGGPDGVYRWRPSFFAGRVLAELCRPSGSRQFVWLDVGPSVTKAGDDSFADMVKHIREFNPALLGGESAATMLFGREGRPGLFTDDIQLSRVRTHGPFFLDAVAALARVPHKALSTESTLLPLSQIRRLHPSAMRDRRLAAMSVGNLDSIADFDSIQLRSLTSTPTFDTPANRTLVALMRRFLAALVRLKARVIEQRLGTEPSEQASRTERRLQDLLLLETRLDSILKSPPFSDVRSAETTAAGLTQVAAQPTYSRAYRLGCAALNTGVEGDDRADLLHVKYSWGIYETWCYLAVLQVVSAWAGVPAVRCAPVAVSAELAHRCESNSGKQLELYFQPLFPSEAPSKSREGFSISRERRPDILLVLRDASGCRAMVLDAKWRSGRENVLEAMESAHIYHDALRLGAQRPCPCVLLLPGPTCVPSLESAEFVDAHGVGAICGVAVGHSGINRLAGLLSNWMAAAGASIS